MILSLDNEINFLKTHVTSRRSLTAAVDCNYHAGDVSAGTDP